MMVRKGRCRVAFIAAVAMLVGCSESSTTGHGSDEKVGSASQTDATPGIDVVASVQDAQGATQQDFDLDFLKALEAYTLERYRAKSKEVVEYRRSQGEQIDDVDFESEAIYVESGKMKLAVIRFDATEGSNTVVIVGIVGNELRRIACSRNSTERVPLSYGNCAEKIHEVFGVRIGA